MRSSGCHDASLGFGVAHSNAAVTLYLDENCFGEYTLHMSWTSLICNSSFKSTKAFRKTLCKCHNYKSVLDTIKNVHPKRKFVTHVSCLQHDYLSLPAMPYTLCTCAPFSNQFPHESSVLAPSYWTALPQAVVIAFFRTKKADLSACHNTDTIYAWHIFATQEHAP